MSTPRPAGALTGLTRVRRFQQDDGHIFCTVAQIKQEVANVLDMIRTVYGFLEMTFMLKLSTRPENFLGDINVWDRAEMLMTEALNEYSAATGTPWSLNPGDGAFYGPKIDVQVFDALKRTFQCATAQLDFVLPERFNLSYQSAGGEDGAAAATERPVMVHRAVLGSVERMIAILTEHYAGKWPFFLSPRQALVVPVSKTFSEYAEQVQKKVSAAGFYVDVGCHGTTSSSSSAPRRRPTARSTCAPATMRCTARRASTRSSRSSSGWKPNKSPDPPRSACRLPSQLPRSTVACRTMLHFLTCRLWLIIFFLSTTSARPR